jgi:hypothetical protein
MTQLLIRLADSARHVLPLAALLICVFCLNASGQEADDRVDAFQETLSHGNYPWYDKAHDDARPLRTPQQQNREPSGVARLINILAWILLLPALLYLLCRIVAATREKVDLQPLGSEPQPRQSAIKLPVANDGTYDYYAAATQAAKVSDFRSAIVCLFNHQLGVLNRYNLIRLDKSGSNRKYLRQLRDGSVQSAFQKSTLVFEAVFFGRHNADRDLYDKFEANHKNLEQALPKLTTVSGGTGAATALLLALLLIAGCSRHTIEYGHSYGKSINGSSVFFDYLEARGHVVRRMFDFQENDLQRANVLVLFNRHKDGLPAESIAQLNDWLLDEPGRVVIYVARDYEVHIDHPGADPKNTRTGSFFDDEEIPTYDVFTDWDTVSTTAHYGVRQGDPLADGVSTQAELFLDNHPLSVDDGENMLVAHEAFVVRQPVGKSEIYLVANGSCLLNYQLADSHDNRQIAANLVNRLAENRVVYFIEGHQQPGISSDSSDAWFQNPFSFLFVEPINWLAIHWLLVGFVFMLYRLPIFGRPHDPAESSHREFAAHIEAYGNLMQHTGNTNYAGQMIRNYLETVRRKS